MLDFMKRPIRALGRYVGGRIAHEYREGKLFGETLVRQTKAQAQAHTHAHARATDGFRIQKNKSFRQAQQDSANRAAQAENTRRWEAAEQKARAYQQQVASRRTRRREDANIKTPRAAVHKVSTITVIVPEPKPNANYMEELRASYPASDSVEECHQRTQNMLQSILGPERAKVGVGLPSGHSGISDDPVLAKYNHDQHVQQTLRIHDEYQTIQRQKLEEQKRKAAEHQAQRVERIIMFKHYWDIYQERVKNLVQVGPQLDAQIAQLLQAFDNGDLFTLQTTAHVLSTGTLEPINQLFDTMKEHIKLEDAGAQELRNSWPLANIEQVLNSFNDANLASFDYQVQYVLGYMLQLLRAACAHISGTVPLVNPLNDPEPQTFVSAPIPVSFKQYHATATAQPSPGSEQQPKQQQYQQQPLPVTEGINAGKNFSSFAALTSATKAATSTQGNSAQDNNAAPTAKVQSLLTYVNTHVLDLEFNTTSLFTNDSVSSSRRTESMAILQGIADIAAGETGLLKSKDGEGQMMKVAIELMISKIVNKANGSERNKKKNRELECLAHAVLKIWT